MELDPLKSSTLFFKRLSAQKLNRKEEANELFEKVVRIDAKLSNDFLYKGKALDELNQYEKGI